MYCSVRENGFVNASIQSSSSEKSLKQLSKASCMNMIFSTYSRSPAHSLCPFNCGNVLKSLLFRGEINGLIFILNALISFTKLGINLISSFKFR